ncbi:MAG: HEAT repeat domain-containing protein [bacterium]
MGGKMGLIQIIPMKKNLIFSLLGIVILSFTLTLSSVRGEEPQLTIGYNDGFISIAAENVTIEKILRELSNKIGLIMKIKSKDDGFYEKRYSGKIEKVPPQKAFEAVLRGVNYIFTSFPTSEVLKQKQLKTAHIFVLGNGKRKRAVENLILPKDFLYKKPLHEYTLEELQDACRYGSKDDKLRALIGLSRCKEPGARELLKSFLTGDDSDLANEAVNALSIRALKLGERDKVIPLLAEALKDQNSKGAYSAMLALGKLKDNSVLPSILPYLKAADPHLQSAAARALGLLGSSDAIKPLTQTVMQSKDKNAQILALKALGSIGTDEAMNVVKEIFKFGEIEQQQAAAALLARSGKGVDNEIEKEILDKLRNGEIEHSTLRAFAHSPYVDLLSSSLTDTTVNDSTKKEIIRALSTAENGNGAQVLSAAFNQCSSSEIKKEVLQRVQNLGADVGFAFYSSCIEDESDSALRKLAVENLIAYRFDPKLNEPLSVALTDDNLNVRRAAIDVIDNIVVGKEIDKKFIPLLKGALNENDHYIKEKAQLALERITF